MLSKKKKKKKDEAKDWNSILILRRDYLIYLSVYTNYGGYYYCILDFYITKLKDTFNKSRSSPSSLPPP